MYDTIDRRSSLNDLIKALKQIRKWNETQRDKITNHIIMFPYNFDGCHWCLGLIRMSFQPSELSCKVEIYNPLPMIGNKEVQGGLLADMKTQITKVFETPRYIKVIS